jgi:NAD dependent epimerase/dehydratase family enzyme
MKILIVSDNGLIADPLRQLLVANQHDIWILTSDESKRQLLQHSAVHLVLGNPAENGSWLNVLPPALDLIINLYTPYPNQKISNADLENIQATQITKIAQNISYIAERTKCPKLFQLIPPNYYGNVVTGTISERNPENLNSFALGYQGLIRHFNAAANIATTFLILANFIYNSEGQTYPAIPKLFNKIYPIINHGDNWISVIHLDDLCSSILHLLNNNISEKIINLVDGKPIMQKDWIKMLSRVNLLPHPLPIPTAISNLLYGQAATTNLTNSAKLKNELLKSTNYWFKYPDYQAGLAKFLVNM